MKIQISSIETYQNTMALRILLPNNLQEQDKRVSLEEIAKLNMGGYFNEISGLYNSSVYITHGINNQRWVVIPFTGGCNFYSIN